MPDWSVAFDDAFDLEWQTWPREAQDELLAPARLLEDQGPALRRLHADTLKGSKYTNMKELRFDAANAAWRVAFAFDPGRKAILLTGGSKSGMSQKKFYNSLIKTADDRFSRHLAELRKSKVKR